MAELFVKTNSHHYVCRVTTPMARMVVEKFAKRFVQYGIARKVRGVYVRDALKTFAAATKNLVEYRFHVNTLEEFKRHIQSSNLGPNFAIWEQADLPAAVEVEFVPRQAKLSSGDPLELRENDEYKQVSAVEYLTNGAPPNSKLLGVQTGKGKGIISMFAMARIGLRVLLVLKPEFVTKWIDELIDILELETEDIMVVRSTAHLKALIELSLAGELQAKVVIVNNVIYRNWVSTYELMHQDSLDIGFGCYPDELMALIGAGIRLVDEVHKEFHWNFKLDLYTHGMYVWGSSATLDSKDAFMNKMYEIAYPVKDRFLGGAYDRYVNYTALTYRFEHPEKIRFQERGRTEYSHIVFEESISKQPKVLANYLNLINLMAQAKYLKKDYQRGERLLIFAASIEMCTLITEYFKRLYPHLDVRRYVGEDPRENLLDPDIRVSTIGSAGTGHDIANLTTVLMTTAINSVQANLQAFGRLRKLTKSGKTPELVYWVNADNAKHMEYHEDKVKLLSTRALNMAVLPAPTLL